ncbi:hypothetical protein CRU99_13650 [Malaciobacter mytili]|uniref:GNAT family N-acetyltransferase n=1 Tax=Malaciobacter mytili TaxID=603050 RepID=UPI00100AF401|nr:GNAT family N-acetyltransferase [Malaciobacter mytili]RXI35991.1 hypothetical protein CRU99_13650 [Malaciobacter mytili]
MKAKFLNNKIYIKDEDKAYLNANIIDENTIFIELLKVEYKYRNKKVASNMMEKSIEYLKTKGFKQIYLNALPLDSFSPPLEKLKTFYKKFDFNEIQSLDNSNVNLMLKVI